MDAFWKLAILLTLAIIWKNGGVYAALTETCQARNESYSISDSEQCDLYYECDKTGKTSQRLCDDGFVFSEGIRQCDYPHASDCSKRPKLQPSQSTDPQCERKNGFYAFPPRDSCAKFYHCLEGKAYEKTCPEGVIFDPKTGSCVHPDMAKRQDCTAHTVLNFKCPNMNQRFSRLRFGDHDRFSHPTDCRKFFICLADGEPRIGGCPFGKVFHQKTGFCDTPKKVPECKDYYVKSMKDGKLEMEDGEEPEANSSSKEDLSKILADQKRNENTQQLKEEEQQKKLDKEQKIKDQEQKKADKQGQKEFK